MKGNSERVPNKNIRDFNGTPLYHKVLYSLLSSKYVNQVVINTDSEKIKEDSKQFGDRVLVLDRPEEIRGDYVSMNKIIEYDLSRTDADIYIQTHSTCPLLKTESIDKALEMMFRYLETKEYDSMFSVTRMQTRLYKENAEAYNHDPKELLRTQDLKPLYEENSNFYIFTKESFTKAEGKRIGLKPFMFETSKIESVDIDEPDDFVIAEAIYKLFER